jgi:glycosyltransferase involved in cell wall biosynthesis
MRVAILGIKSVPGVMGADRAVESLLPHLPTGHDYTVYVVRGIGPRPVDRPNVKFVRIPALRGKHAFAASYFLLSSLHAALFGGYDIAHVHNSDFGVFCLPLRLRRRLRIVGTFHGDPYLRSKWGRGAKAFLRVSEWCLVRAAHALTSVSPVKRVPGRKVAYIPNGIEPWQAQPEHWHAASQRLGLNGAPFVMFACGRLDPTKGLHHLTEAYTALPDGPELLVVGDFSHDAAYSQRIEAEAQRDGRISLHRELVPRAELLEAVARSAVFVFPSEVEGMAMMLLEAVSCGAKVVCSNIPENLEVVGADHPGLFESGSPSSLRKALGRALATNGQASATNGIRRRVLDRFRWEAAAARYGQLYGELASGLSAVSGERPDMSGSLPHQA